QESCPLRLWTEKQGQTIRLEVVSNDIICGPRGVNVYDGYSLKARNMGSLCDSRTIRGTAHNMILKPVDRTRTAPVYLKLSVLNSTCNGIVQKKKAIHDQVRELPRLASSETGQAHDLNCTYLLESDHSSDLVEVTLEGRLVEWNEYNCQGDVIKFYDEKGGCSRETELLANSTKQILTSPNYPMYYPMNSYCIYKLEAPEEHYIVLEVTDSSLENDCSDNVKLYNGHQQTYENYIGRWCGDETPKFKSKGNKLLVVFTADKEYNSGGFEAKFYTTVDENPLLFPIIIGALSLALITAVISVIVYICVQRKKKLQRS
ncbi:POU domain protein, partial [Elysia marginata]